MNRLMATMALFVTALLLFSTAASAWHSTGERENLKFTSYAGEPLVQEDGADCMESVGHAHGGEQKPHCIVLYAHNYDLLQPVPMNVQRPPECFPDLAMGFTGTPGVEPLWSFSRAELYSSAGFVEYEESRCQAENYKPRIHPERGLTSDILISTSTPIVGYWYLSVDSIEFSPLGLDGHEQGLDFGVMPCVTVEMFIQTGRYWGVGEILTSGKTTKTMVSTPGLVGDLDPTPVPDPCPDSDGVITPEQVSEFRVEFDATSRPIPEHTGYLVYVMWYQHNAGPEGDEQEAQLIIQREWNRHNGANYPNRIVIPVEESVRVERVRPQEFDGKIFIHTVLNSPWGSYDVDTKNIRVEIFTEGGEKIDIKHLEEPVLRYSVDHDGHFKPVNATFPWAYKNENLPDGRYTAKVTVPNWQHTAEATRSATFVISGDRVEAEDEDGEGSNQPELEDSPASAALLAALALIGLAGVAVLRRRE